MNCDIAIGNDVNRRRRLADELALLSRREYDIGSVEIPALTLLVARVFQVGRIMRQWKIGIEPRRPQIGTNLSLRRW